MKNKKKIIIILVVVIALIGGISAFAYNKSHKYLKLIKAYDKMFDAKSFNCEILTSSTSDSWKYNIEMYNRGKSNDDLMLAFIDGSGKSFSAATNTTRYNYRGEKLVKSEYNKEDYMPKLITVLSENNPESLYNVLSIKEYTNLDYKETYDLALNMAKDYFTSSDKLDYISSTSIEGDTYVCVMNTKSMIKYFTSNSDFKVNTSEVLRENDNVMESYDYNPFSLIIRNICVADYNEKLIEDDIMKMTLKLNNGYVDSIVVEMSRSGTVYASVSLKFSNINKINDANSEGYSLIQKFE